jgi:hypothetical protein
MLAFNRGSQGVTSIYTMPVAGGDERRLTDHRFAIWMGLGLDL